MWTLVVAYSFKYMKMRKIKTKEKEKTWNKIGDKENFSLHSFTIKNSGSF